MSHEHTFEMIEHTADVGVAGYGVTIAEAFENTAFGMFSIMADLTKYEPTGTVTVESEGDDEIALLQGFLSSLIVIFDADGLLPLDFNITRMENESLKCDVSVRKIGGDIEWLGPSIKAVTYHQMDVRKENGRWRAQAIFDV